MEEKLDEVTDQELDEMLVEAQPFLKRVRARHAEEERHAKAKRMEQDVQDGQQMNSREKY